MTRLRAYGWARILRDFALVRVVLWAILIPFALHFGWANSVAFVTVLSLLALVLSDLAVYQGGRAEVASVDADTANVDANNVTIRGR
jgi:RsiW-degrading membrane proteinase PrsW (M82 family)